jgi:hypothetical protein
MQTKTTPKMISPQEAAKTKALKERLAAFQETTEAAKKEIMPELLEFFVTLGMEGERSSVVLGAERINVALEALIKSSVPSQKPKSLTDSFRFPKKYQG